MIKKYIFVIYLLGQTLLYGQEKPPLLTTSQMHKDLVILKAAFTKLHPGVYRYTTPPQLNRYFKDALKHTDRSLSLAGFYIELSKVAVKLYCGHTYVNPYNQKKVVSNQLFTGQVLPLLFQVIDYKLIVTHNLSEQTAIKSGDELVSINGVDARTIIDSLLKVSRADGRNGLNKQLDNLNLSPYLSNSNKYALFDIYFPLFFPNSNTGYYDLAVKQFRGNLIHLQVTSVTKLQRQQRYQQRFAAEYMQPTGTFSWLTQRCGYLKIKDFNSGGWGKDYKKFLDSVFIEMCRRKTTNLVIDIRGNEGGDDDVRNKVISYLIRKPVSYSIRRYYRFLTVPDSLMPYLDTWDPTFKKPKAPSDYDQTSEQLYYKRNTYPADTIVPNANHFVGQIYLLTSATNSSSSFFMADILQQSKAAQLIGEPTGGTKQGINGGQFFFLTLPQSGIEVDIPLVYQAPVVQRRDEGIKPDVTVKIHQLDIATGLDVQLQFIKQHLK